jgi:hypothetical protein
MARRGREIQQRPHVKGFRPGKAPKKLKKKLMKQSLPEMTATQQRMFDLFVERTPEESKKLIGRWVLGTLIGAIALTLLSILAWRWSWIAGVPLTLGAGFVFFSHIRLRSQRAQLEEMAEQVATVTRSV